MSLNWPIVTCAPEDLDRLHVACSKEKVVPYGSYVVVSDGVRCGTEELAQKLRTHIKESKLTYHDVMMTHEWSYRQNFESLMKRTEDQPRLDAIVYPANKMIQLAYQKKLEEAK